MGLSEIGNIAHQNWAAIPDHFDHAALGKWIVMPNHVHGLIRIMDWPVQHDGETVETCHGMSLHRGHGMSLRRGAQFGKPQSGSLSMIINQYKSSVTRWVRKNDNTHFAWQARFHDHIVRDNRSLGRIQAYIIRNPQKWEEDRYHGIN